MSYLMIPIRSNWMNGCLIRKLIHFLCFRGLQGKEECLVFEGDCYFICCNMICCILFGYSHIEDIIITNIILETCDCWAYFVTTCTSSPQSIRTFIPGAPLLIEFQAYVHLMYLRVYVELCAIRLIGSLENCIVTK